MNLQGPFARFGVLSALFARNCPTIGFVSAMEMPMLILVYIASLSVMQRQYPLARTTPRESSSREAGGIGQRMCDVGCGWRECSLIEVEP